MKGGKEQEEGDVESKEETRERLLCYRATMQTIRGERDIIYQQEVFESTASHVNPARRAYL